MAISAARPKPMADFPGSGSISSANCAARSRGFSSLTRKTGEGLPGERTVPPGQLYGRRRARPLRPGQRRLQEELLPRMAIELPESGPTDPRALFTNTADEIWLEIGFGAGEHLAAQAERHPEIGFIGSEVFEDGIARPLGGVARRGLGNVRLLPQDARLLLAALPPQSLGRVFSLFPDPWPKRRHHNRRLVAPATLDLLAVAMTDGAELRPATEHRDYPPWAP